MGLESLLTAKITEIEIGVAIAYISPIAHPTTRPKFDAVVERKKEILRHYDATGEVLLLNPPGPNRKGSLTLLDPIEKINQLAGSERIQGVNFHEDLYSDIDGFDREIYKRSAEFALRSISKHADWTSGDGIGVGLSSILTRRCRTLAAQGQTLESIITLYCTYFSETDIRFNPADYLKKARLSASKIPSARDPEFQNIEDILTNNSAIAETRAVLERPPRDTLEEILENLGYHAKTIYSIIGYSYQPWYPESLQDWAYADPDDLAKRTSGLGSKRFQEIINAVQAYLAQKEQ